MLISVMAIVTIIDSQFIKVFYGTDFELLVLCICYCLYRLLIIASIIIIIILLFVKSNDFQARSSKTLLFRIAYTGTSIVQYSISLIIVIMISQMLVFHGYSKVFSILVVYLVIFGQQLSLESYLLGSYNGLGLLNHFHS